MNRFFRSRLCRCCVCLILVLVLLISWSPIRAQASVLGGIASGALLFGDDAIAIILAIIGGLGVCAVAGSEASDLETRAIARSAMDAMEEAGNFVKDGALSLYSSATAAWSYAVSTDMVQWLHDWLFTTNKLHTTNNQIPGGFSYVNINGDTITCEASFRTFRYKWGKNKYEVYYNTHNLSFYVNGTDSTQRVVVDGVGVNYTRQKIYTEVGVLELDVSYENQCIPAAYRLLNSDGYAHEILTDYELELGVVAPPGTDIETEYGEYIVIVAPNGIPDTGGDGGDEEQPKIPVLPVPYLPPSEIPNVPQEDIWKGNKVEIDNPDTGDTPDPTTGTDTDDPDSGSNNPTTPNPDPGTNPGTGVPSDIGKYQIDLKDFFPFCIPFDLYRFIEILCAEPEAPVFHWEFNVFGELHSLDVDLSPWNPHAQLFRDAQVGLFIMGLLWITRKFIKW